MKKLEASVRKGDSSPKSNKIPVQSLSYYEFVTEQDPVRPFWTDLFLIYSASAPLWSTQIILSDTHFLSCLQVSNFKWKKLTHLAQNPARTRKYFNNLLPIYFASHKPIIVDHKLIIYPFLSLPLEMFCWNPLSLSFLHVYCPRCLHGSLQ